MTANSFGSPEEREKEARKISRRRVYTFEDAGDQRHGDHGGSPLCRGPGTIASRGDTGRFVTGPADAEEEGVGVGPEEKESFRNAAGSEEAETEKAVGLCNGCADVQGVLWVIV